MLRQLFDPPIGVELHHGDIIARKKDLERDNEQCRQDQYALVAEADSTIPSVSPIRLRVHKTNAPQARWVINGNKRLGYVGNEWTDLVQHELFLARLTQVERTAVFTIESKRIVLNGRRMVIRRELDAIRRVLLQRKALKLLRQQFPN